MNWRTVIESFPCPKCNAKAGEPCRTQKGAKTSPHAMRGTGADRCPKCNERLPSDAEPWELCDRCRLIRHLEIERATTYRRPRY